MPSHRPSSRGLSPRVRGNPLAGSAGAAALRSIPTCAGEPVFRARCATPAMVYPHVCGGTVGSRANGVAIQGLSPRVRGNPSFTLRFAYITGSIPTCAGEPAVSCWLCAGAGVYPHVCGGTGGLLLALRWGWGLSPRVRGNRVKIDRINSRTRSIPTCAGEPGVGVRFHSCWRVYPHVCGGTGDLANRKVGLWGLSPRVRGNRGAWRDGTAVRRSIPTCAGEPAFNLSRVV